jgi:hypothetical protein
VHPPPLATRPVSPILPPVLATCKGGCTTVPMYGLYSRCLLQAFSGELFPLRKSRLDHCIHFAVRFFFTSDDTTTPPPTHRWRANTFAATLAKPKVDQPKIPAHSSLQLFASTTGLQARMCRTISFLNRVAGQSVHQTWFTNLRMRREAWSRSYGMLRKLPNESRFFFVHKSV